MCRSTTHRRRSTTSRWETADPKQNPPALPLSGRPIRRPFSLDWSASVATFTRTHPIQGIRRPEDLSRCLDVTNATVTPEVAPGCLTTARPCRQLIIFRLPLTRCSSSAAFAGHFVVMGVEPSAPASDVGIRLPVKKPGVRASYQPVGSAQFRLATPRLARQPECAHDTPCLAFSTKTGPWQHSMTSRWGSVPLRSVVTWR
jgi:hypothetical protein